MADAGCAYCEAQGAKLKCIACRRRVYCDKRCQKKDWKSGHREECQKIQEEAVAPGQEDDDDDDDDDADAYYDAASGGEAEDTEQVAEEGEVGVRGEEEGGKEDEEETHLCPLCLENKDDLGFNSHPSTTITDHTCGMCLVCGQKTCGPCVYIVERKMRLHFARFGPNCPTCRASLMVSDEENFLRLWTLVHDKPPGRHTPEALYRLGYRYGLGKGVPQSHPDAWAWFARAAEHQHPGGQTELGTMYDAGQYTGEKTLPSNFSETCFRQAAEQGYSAAQCKLGLLYFSKRLYAKATKWLQLSAEQGSHLAQKELATMQQSAIDIVGACHTECLIPTPPLGACVTIILLTSAASKKYNGRRGKVMVPPRGTLVKNERAVVLLEGEEAIISFKLMNIKVDDTDIAEPLTTCHGPSCQKKGTQLCKRCKAVKYCSAECQIKDWKRTPDGHKSQCRTETGGQRADSDQAWAGGGSSVPDAEVCTCYICLESDDDLIPLGCACRGSAGKAHLACIIEAHAAKQGKDDEKFSKISHWEKCLICKHSYTGKMHTGVTKDAVRRYAHVPDFMSTHLAARHADAINAEGRYAEAEAIYRKCIALNFQMHQHRTYQNAVIVHNLGLNLRCQNKLKESIALLRENLENWIKLEGRKAKDTLVGQHELACSLKMDFQYAEAEHLYRKTLATMKRVFPKNDQYYIITLSGLAALLCDGLKKPAEAEGLFRQILTITNRVYGPEHPTTLVDLNNLGTALYAQGKWEEAFAVGRDCLKKKQRSQGPAHPDTLTSLFRLSHQLRNQRRVAEGKAALQDVLAACGGGADAREAKANIQKHLRLYY